MIKKMIPKAKVRWSFNGSLHQFCKTYMKIGEFECGYWVIYTHTPQCDFRPQLRDHFFLCQVTVGTNPISVAAPGKDGDSFVLDMATSSVALGKVSGWEFGRKRQ